MAAEVVRTVAGRQGVWCFPGRHLLPLGSEYVHREHDGVSTCLEHRDVELKPVNVGGGRWNS